MWGQGWSTYTKHQLRVEAKAAEHGAVAWVPSPALALSLVPGTLLHLASARLAAGRLLANGLSAQVVARQPAGRYLTGISPLVAAG